MFPRSCLISTTNPSTEAQKPTPSDDQTPPSTSKPINEIASSYRRYRHGYHQNLFILTTPMIYLYISRNIMSLPLNPPRNLIFILNRIPNFLPNYHSILATLTCMSTRTLMPNRRSRYKLNQIRVRDRMPMPPFLQPRQTPRTKRKHRRAHRYPLRPGTGTGIGIFKQDIVRQSTMSMYITQIGILRRPRTRIPNTRLIRRPSSLPLYTRMRRSRSRIPRILIRS